MFVVTATHQGHRREFGPFPREHEARDWIIRNGETISNARVTPRQSPTLHYATQPATEQRALAAAIRAEAARLAAEDDNPEPPF